MTYPTGTSTMSLTGTSTMILSTRRGKRSSFVLLPLPLLIDLHTNRSADRLGPCLRMRLEELVPFVSRELVVLLVCPERLIHATKLVIQETVSIRVAALLELAALPVAAPPRGLFHIISLDVLVRDKLPGRAWLLLFAATSR